MVSVWQKGHLSICPSLGFKEEREGATVFLWPQRTLNPHYKVDLKEEEKRNDNLCRSRSNKTFFSLLLLLYSPTFLLSVVEVHKFRNRDINFHYYHITHNPAKNRLLSVSLSPFHASHFCWEWRPLSVNGSVNFVIVRLQGKIKMK